MSRLIEAGHGGCAPRLDVGQMDRSFVPPSVHHYSARGTIVATKPRDGSIHAHLRFVPRTAHPRGRARHRPDHAPAGHRHEARTHRYFTRSEAVVCGTEEAARIYGMLGDVRCSSSPRARVLRPATSSCAYGARPRRCMGWKCCLNIFEYYSALATKTRTMVDRVHEANPRCEVLTTRKRMPGTKPLGTKALLVGGSFPHRLGLSETVLIFAQHLAFYEGGIEALIADIPEIKARCCEKKLFVEADAADAQVCRGGRRWHSARQGARIRARHARERDQGHRSACHDHRCRRRELDNARSMLRPALTASRRRACTLPSRST